MTINYNPGDLLMPKQSYIRESLRFTNQPPQTLQLLGYMGSNIYQVISTSHVVDYTLGLLSAIHLIPIQPSDPFYNDGAGVQVTFNSDTYLNNSFDLSNANIIDPNNIISMRIYNNSGVTIGNSKVVVQTGFDTIQQLPTAAIASSAVLATSKVYGIAEEDIAAGAAGAILVLGIFEGIDTSGFNLGDTVFLGTAGNISTTAGVFTGIVGKVTTVGVADGAIFVNGANAGSGGSGSVDNHLGNTLTVDQVFGDDATAQRESTTFTYATVQAAIDDAVVGDTILIAPGSYDDPITLKTGITLEAYGTRGKVIFNGAVTFAPTGVGEEACTLMFIDLIGTFSFDGTGQVMGTSLVRFDSCRFFDDITLTGKSHNADGAQFLTCAFDPNLDLICNDAYVSMQGGLGAFNTVTIGGTNDGGLFQSYGLQGTTGTFTISLGNAYIEQWGSINSIVANGGTAFFWDTPSSSLEVASGAVVKIYSEAVNGPVDCLGGVELHDSATANVHIGPGALLIAKDTFIAGTVTVDATGTFQCWDFSINVLNNAGSSSVFGTNIQTDVTSTGSCVLQNCSIGGTLTNDAGTTVLRDSTFQDIVVNSDTYTYSCDIQSSITVNAVFALVHDGRVAAATVTGGFLRLSGGVTVDAVTRTGGTVDGVGADMRSTTLVGGSINRNILLIDVAGTSAGTNTVTFNHSFVDANYHVHFTETSNIGGNPPRVHNLTATDFQFEDDTGGRDFQITVIRYQASDA